MQRFSVPEDGPFVRHAQLALGSNLVMVGSVRPDDGLDTPRHVGIATQGLYVNVEDVDAHFAHACAAGAEITVPLQDSDVGRAYHARDREGHLWVFGSYLPDTPAGRSQRP